MKNIAGLLLAAGYGRRFDPAGSVNKLLQMLPDGMTIVQQSARHLRAVCPTVIAIIGPESATEIRPLLAHEGCIVITCPESVDGMGHSLACGAQAAISLAVDGLMIALADMPFVKGSTIGTLAATLQSGAGIVVPVMAGRRGNPVGFASCHFQQLLQMHGDTGARSLLKSYPACEVAVDDPGIFHDIDTPGDLPGCQQHGNLMP